MAERTGWRDERISQMHRLWGEKLSFTNIDCIWVECNSTKCLAFFEYKMGKEAMLEGWQLKVLIDAAAGRPAFFVKYANDGSLWKILPLNDSAKRIIPAVEEMSFENFLIFQYRLRGLKVDDIAMRDFIADMGWHSVDWKDK